MLVGGCGRVRFLRCCSPAGRRAAPALQLYLEGGTYDSEREAWTLSPAGSSAGEPFRLWAIGNVAGPGGRGAISNGRIAVAYDAGLGEIDLSFTPARTDGFAGFPDPSTPDAVSRTQFVSDVATGGVPQLQGTGPGTLPPHGVYENGVAWQEFDIGAFTQTDSPIADFIDEVPDAPEASTGQINVYEIAATGPSGESLHGATLFFDLYGTVSRGGGPGGGSDQAVFAPFSHTAAAEVNIVPTPSAAAAGLVLLGGLALRRG